MEERYMRNLGALTPQDCRLLREKKVFIAGCGGLGGYILDLLLRVGVGRIAVADGDVFEPSNLNRQLLSAVDALGAGKADTAAAYAARVNPDVRFQACGGFITEENVSELIAGCHVVLDALDNLPSRRLLKSECDRQGIPYVFGAVSGWVAEAAVSPPGDRLLDKLYPPDVAEPDKSALSFTPALCAAIQTSLCVKLLCGRPVEPGRLYYFDLLGPEFEKLL